jgi:hypothetical protein
MYAWDQPASSADEHAEPGVAPRDAGRAASATQVAYASHASHANRASRADHPGRADHPSRAVHAVQVALDRRDNGGDAGSGRLG